MDGSGLSVRSGRRGQSENRVENKSAFQPRVLVAWREGFPFASCSCQASRHSEKEVISLSQDNASVSDRQLRPAVTQYLSKPQMTLSPILREADVKDIDPVALPDGLK